MTVTIVHGQNHKGSSYHLAKLLVDALDCEKQVHEFFLPRDLGHFCAGCYACVEDEAACPYYEQKNVILQAIEQSDLLVFTTPNYCMAPSAPMKAFMDLTFTYWLAHKPRACMFRKRAVVLSTTAGMGAGAATKPVARAMQHWGVPWVKSYGVAVQAMNWQGVAAKKKQQIEKNMKALAKKLSTAPAPTVPMKTKALFAIMAGMQKADMGSSPTEKAHWERQGWLGKGRPWKQNG